MKGLLLLSCERRLRDVWHPEFPTVRASRQSSPHVDARVVSAAAWLDERSSLFDFDALIGDAASGPLPPLHLLDDAPGRLEEAALGLLTRYQGALNRRNRASSGIAFQRAFDTFRTRHDLSKPLVRADFCHALDTWQWLLRLAPDATLVLQLAALLHDVERLSTEADRRVEQQATDYQAFKDAHAQAGAEHARKLLLDAGLEAPVADHVADLVCGHERAASDPDRAVLNDADALSFFSLNSLGFLTHYGLDHTRRKVAWTLARLSPAARMRLAHVRLSPAIAELLTPRSHGGHP